MYLFRHWVPCDKASRQLNSYCPQDCPARQQNTISPCIGGMLPATTYSPSMYALRPQLQPENSLCLIYAKIAFVKEYQKSLIYRKYTGVITILLLQKHILKSRENWPLEESAGAALSIIKHKTKCVHLYETTAQHQYHFCLRKSINHTTPNVLPILCYKLYKQHWSCCPKSSPPVTCCESTLCVSDWKSIGHTSTFYTLGSLRIQILVSICERRDSWKSSPLWKHYSRGDRKYKCQLQ